MKLIAKIAVLVMFALCIVSFSASDTLAQTVLVPEKTFTVVGGSIATQIILSSDTVKVLTRFVTSGTDSTKNWSVTTVLTPDTLGGGQNAIKNIEFTPPSPCPPVYEPGDYNRNSIVDYNDVWALFNKVYFNR